MTLDDLDGIEDDLEGVMITEDIALIHRLVAEVRRLHDRVAHLRASRDEWSHAYNALRASSDR